MARLSRHKKFRFLDDDKEVDYQKYQDLVMPLFRRAVAALNSGFLEETIAICMRVHPGRILHLGTGYSGKRGMTLASFGLWPDSRWEAFVYFFFQEENFRILNFSGGQHQVIFEAPNTTTEIVPFDPKLLELWRNGGTDILSINMSASNCSDEMLVEVERLNTKPPKFQDFAIDVSHRLEMSAKSKLKRERKRKWRNS